MNQRNVWELGYLWGVWDPITQEFLGVCSGAEAKLYYEQEAEFRKLRED